jgi:hypothetical protein
MKNLSVLLSAVLIVGMACSPENDVLSTGATPSPPANALGADAATNVPAPAMVDSGNVTVLPPQPTPQSDASVPTAPPNNTPFACLADAFYPCEGEYECPGGMTMVWQCNATGDGVVWIEGTDGESCECRTIAPPATNDAAVVQPSPPDAGTPDFVPKDTTEAGAEPLVPLTDASGKPDVLAAQPDTSAPKDSATSAAPDIGVPNFVLPDAALVKNPDTAPADAISVVLEHDAASALSPDTIPDAKLIALQPEAGPEIGTPDSSLPDIVPNTNLISDAAPDTLLQPDAGCAITVSLTAPATTGPQLHCYSRTIYWSAVGCSPTEFRVTWSKTPGPGCLLRMSDAGTNFIDDYVIVSDPTARSQIVRDSLGPGTYYFKVCQQNGDTCGPCSDDLQIDLTS